MTTRSSPPTTAKKIEAEIGYAADPLSYIRDEHLQRRQVLSDLDSLAEAETADLDLTRAALAALEVQRPLLDADERDDLLPLLRRRALPEDGIEPLLGRLSEDYLASRALIGPVCRALQGLLSDGGTLGAGDREAILAFAARERRQLIFENAIVLPLARARLTEADLRSLALRMAARRGLCLLPEPDRA
ncbi:MAG: hypothetical protein Kilf2KO_40840 [Rhodospirillales bacterium]